MNQQPIDFGAPLSSFFVWSTRIIGITGRPRSGKDTIGGYLERAYSFHGESFAWPLKEAVRVMYGWGFEHTDGDLKEVVDPYWNTTPRAVMRSLGTEVGRKLDEMMWIKSMRQRLVLHAIAMSKRHARLAACEVRNGRPLDLPMNIVIKDVRHKNEMSFVRGLGGEMWRVSRPSLPERPDLHSSDTELDGVRVDHEFVNDGDVHDLRRKVDTLMAADPVLRSLDESALAP